MMKLPGHRLLPLVRGLVPPAAMANVLEPLVADWQREWLRATTGRARARVRLTGALALIVATLGCVVHDDVPLAVRRASARTLLAFAAAGVGLPLLLTATLVSHTLSPQWLVLYVPSWIAAGLAFAMLPVAMRVGAAADRHAARRHLVRVSLVTSLAVLIVSNVIGPSVIRAVRQHALLSAPGAADPMRRQRIAQRPLAVDELTPRQAVMLHVVTAQARPSPNAVRRELNERAALALFPCVLAAVGWGLTRASRPAPAYRLTLWWLFAGATVLAGSIAASTLARWWHLPYELAAWLPLGLWLLAAAVLLLARTPRSSPAPMTSVAR